MSESSLPLTGEMSSRRRKLRQHPATVVAVISVGGVLGALARYGLSTAFPHSPAGMPWATLSINASGCLFIGVLMVALTDVLPSQRLLRPFLGVGVLGGYTTFSSFTVEVQQALTAGAARVALANLGLTLFLSLFGVFAGVVLTRALLRWTHGTRRKQ